MNWKDIQIFLFGFYCCATVFDLAIIFYGIGSVNQRVFLTLILIIGFGTLPMLNKGSSSKINKESVE